jgi:hypothetical protein
LIDVSEVRAASIIRAMIEAAHTSETSVDIDLRTRQYFPEDSELNNKYLPNVFFFEFQHELHYCYFKIFKHFQMTYSVKPC